MKTTSTLAATTCSRARSSPGLVRRAARELRPAREHRARSRDPSSAGRAEDHPVADDRALGDRPLACACVPGSRARTSPRRSERRRRLRGEARRSAPARRPRSRTARRPLPTPRPIPATGERRLRRRESLGERPLQCRAEVRVAKREAGLEKLRRQGALAAEEHLAAHLAEDRSSRARSEAGRPSAGGSPFRALS